MKKSILIMSAVFLSIGGYAQNTVTSLSVNDILVVKNPNGMSEKRVSILNFDNVVGNKTYTVTGTELHKVTSTYTVNSTGITLDGPVASTGTVTIPNGAVATPALTFTSDLDCGLYRIGANNVGVAVNAAKVLDVATTGLGVTGTLTASGLLSPAAAINNSAGTVGAPSYSYTGQTNMGRYKISSTQEGQSISGSLVGGWNASGLFTGYITEQITGSGITFSKQTIQLRTATTYTAGATATAAEVAGGLLVWEAGIDNLQLPTATQMGTQLGAVAGTTFDFVVQNSGGSGTVTVVVGANIVAASALTGGTLLTLVNSATDGMATFRLTFISATACTISRIS